MGKNTLPIIPELPRIDHTQLEYDTIRKLLQNHMIDNFSDNWNDFLESNSGQMMLELFSYFGHNMAFRIDAVTNEAFIPTVQNREHALRILQLVDYQMMAVQQASVMIEATRIDTDYSIQKDITLFDPDLNISTTLTAQNKNDESTYFTVLASQFDYESKVKLNKVKDFVDGILTEVSTNQTNVFAYNGVIRTEIIDDVTGEDNQTYNLNQNNVIWNSVKVLMDNGNGWQKLANNQYLVSEKVKQDGTTTLPVYRLEWDSDNKVKIIFGSEKYGNKPLTGYKLKFQYMVGNGSIGNIGKFGINVTQSCNNTFLNKIVGESNVTFTNSQFEATGGKDKETIEEAKTFAPLLLRTAWKANTREDHNILLTGLPSIRLAKTSSNETSDLVSTYTTHIYVFPNGEQNEFEKYYTLNPTIQQEVLQFMNGNIDNPSHKIIGLDNIVLPAKVLELNIDIAVTKNAHYDGNIIESEIISILKNYFDPQLDDDSHTNNPYFDFNREINKDDIKLSIQLLNSIRSVDKIDIAVSSPIKQYNITNDEIGNKVYDDIMLPVYPNHEEICISTKEKSSDATLELLYSVPTLDDTVIYDEYLENSDIDIDNVNVRCYKKLLNKKPTIDYNGNYSNMPNSWLRYAYAIEDKNTFRAKIYRGTNTSVETNDTAKESVFVNVTNSAKIICTKSVKEEYDNVTYYGDLYLYLIVDNKKVKIKFIVGTYINTPQGIANYINDYIQKSYSLNFDILKASVITDNDFSKLVLQSQFDIDVKNSNTYNQSEQSINGIIGLDIQTVKKQETINYLPCSPKTIINGDENELWFRINGRNQKVTLESSKPTSIFVNQFNKTNNGTDENIDNMILFTTYPQKYKINPNGKVVIQDGKYVFDANPVFVENDQMTLRDEDVSNLKSISEMFIRITDVDNNKTLNKIENGIFTNEQENNGWLSIFDEVVNDDKYNYGIRIGQNIVGNTEQELLNSLDLALKQKNTYFFIGNMFQHNTNYLIEIKARKNFNTTSRIVDSVESNITTTDFSYIKGNTNDVMPYNIQTTKTKNDKEIIESVFENRTKWIDDDSIQQQLQIDFGILKANNSLDLTDTNIIPEVFIDGTNKISFIRTDNNISDIKTTMENVDYSTVDNGFVVVCKANMQWQIKYTDFYDDCKIINGTLQVDTITETRALVSKIAEAINSDINSDGLNKYFYAVVDNVGQQIIMKSKTKKITILDSELSRVLFTDSVNNMSAFVPIDLNNLYTYILKKKDLTNMINGEELLNRGQIYKVRINYGMNNITDSYVEIPFYYYESFDYNGAMNRVKLKNAITNQIPNYNNEQTINAQENEVVLLNYDTVNINIK